MKKASGYLYVILTLILIFGIKATAQGHAKSQVKEQKLYLADLEHQYTEDIKSVLTECGYEGSGVTVTWISEDGLFRDYTVNIHHHKLDNAEDSVKEDLIDAFATAEFSDGAKSFTYAFIE